MADPRQQEVQLAFERGQMSATVRTLEHHLGEIEASVKDIRDQMIIRKEFDALLAKSTVLEGRVEGLSRWQWMSTGGMGAVVLLAQLLPLIRGLVKP